MHPNRNLPYKTDCLSSRRSWQIWIFEVAVLKNIDTYSVNRKGFIKCTKVANNRCTFNKYLIQTHQTFNVPLHNWQICIQFGQTTNGVMNPETAYYTQRNGGALNSLMLSWSYFGYTLQAIA